MPKLHRFLVVDDNADSRFLLVKTLLRKFPMAILQETDESSAAIANVKENLLDAVIVHRTAEVDGVTLVRLLRHLDAKLPIVLVSGVDRAAQGKEAGATDFLNYDAWLRIGTVVAQLLDVPQSAQPLEADPKEPSGGQ